MCLAIPGKLLEITSELDETFRMGRVSFGGVKKDVSLALVPEAKVDDYVMVHVGAAISVVDEEEAKKTFEVLSQLGELEDLNQQPDATG
ncbi:HypC/HybG/HupF family hydrogenase formation chaperone [[Muricauda] lutisoli]|uniref:HypC/HybG/HupF family hydrogenase formation chaperone n=1 Tax=[Muricauda] lutisoli TaxID=2816035 RepID=A0ABS3ESI8_9FLAO|nr:HypC/HybG/HupF family hydrogenase formation chaperone [[Muricauda] lutisoli]MBO0329108.1 HypC/HybG/HupF family hydrogenase formation chaperone [[Muricauda] lutisoli]